MEKAVDTEQRKTIGNLKIEGFNNIGPAQFPWDTVDLTDTGVLGSAGNVIKATKATKEKGRELMDPYIKEICGIIEKLKTIPLGELLSKPKKSP